jgi:hypothetical protein
LFQHENLHLLLSLPAFDNLFCMGPAPDARLLSTRRSHRPPGCFAKISLLQVNTIKSIGWRLLAADWQRIATQAVISECYSELPAFCEAHQPKLATTGDLRRHVLQAWRRL